MLLLRHHVAHELVSLLVNVVGIDQDFADIAVEIVANGADHETRFLIDQERTLAGLGRSINGGPELEQVIEVPLQFGRVPADTRRAGNDAHAIGVLELVKSRLEFGAVLTLDASADTTTPRVVGHQHHVAAGEADERGQGGTLVAPFFLLDLNQQFLAFLDHVVDACLRGRNAALEVLTRDLLERQEAVTIFAVVDETRLQRGLHPRDDRLVDVSLALFAPFDFDLVVEQFLPVDNRQPAFLGLGGVDQHALHGGISFVNTLHVVRTGPDIGAEAR